MDEPFSALDVLTAETLRGELLELWLSKKIPTRAIFVVTHNIEESVLLADRVIVLGKNPGHIRSDFEITLPHPRDRKAAKFVEFVDYIYKIMTQPDAEISLEARSIYSFGHSSTATKISDAAACPHRRHQRPARNSQ